MGYRLCIQYYLTMFVLGRTVCPADLGIAYSVVLGGSSGHPAPPQLEAGRLELASQQLDNAGLVETELCLDGFEWRSVFPGHLDDSGLILQR